MEMNSKEIASLKEELRKNGIFEKKPFATWSKFFISLLAAIILLVIIIRLDTLWIILGLPVCALFIVAVGMMGHEGGHHAAFKSVFANQLLLYLTFPLLAGQSVSYWINKHNHLHHRNPNVKEQDQDINLWPLAIDEVSYNQSPRFLQFLQRHLQSWFFWPLTFFLLLDMRAKSISHLARKVLQGDVDTRRFIDILCVGSHYLLWIIIPCFFYNFLFVLLVYLYLWGCVGVYLSAIFIVGHTAKPIINTVDSYNYVALQFITSRNIKLSPFLSWFFVGLNYQIEHHLFPTISHFKLPQAARIVKAFAEKHQFPYEEEKFFPCLAKVTRYIGGAWQAKAITINE